MYVVIIYLNQTTFIDTFVGVDFYNRRQSVLESSLA